MLTEESCHFRLSPLVCVLRLGRQLRRSGFNLCSYLSIFSVDTIWNPRPCYWVASWFTYCYNPGQNSCDINATTGENDAFFLLPPPPRPPRFNVDVMASNLFQHNQHCWGEGGQQKQALSTTFPSIYNRLNTILISKVCFRASFP